MRALRKIIFVHSAHIRYAEVKLDGNVHFIGTQGVGKSTLLRAVLFFYNADKLHLGIPKEMKSFDEFYLPHANSYIVYEVEHEHGPFSILVFRSSGRACFRFVDAPFNRKWLVDDSGEVTADGKVIRERLNGAFMSRIIDRYEQYRDIVYGNRLAAVGREFKRFSLMESSSYNNILRSIQNVFLNSRLDADFIKDIIIRSMDNDESKIDLGYFRNQVSEFEQQYRDISCWYKLNAKGVSPVRSQADAAVKAYRDLISGKSKTGELCACLNYCLRVSRERLPVLDKAMAELDALLSRQLRLLSEEQHKFDDEKSKLNQEQGVASDKLKQLKNRRDHYESVNIADVLKRFDKEPVLKSRVASLNARFNDLTARHNDITSKFSALHQKIDLQFESERQKHEARILNIKTELQSTIERLIVDCSGEKERIETAFAGKINDTRAIIDAADTALNECDKELLRLDFFEPFKAERAAIDGDIAKMELRKKELAGLHAACEANISRIQSDYEKQEANIMADFRSQKNEKKQETDAVRLKMNDLSTILDRTNGSFYEWLQNNNKNWEQSIGKVIDEGVLYNTELNPQKSAEGDPSLLGVRIDLSVLPLNVRRPQELKQEKARCEKRLRQLEVEVAALDQRQGKAVDYLKRQYTSEIKEQSGRKAEFSVELQTLPQKIKEKQLNLEDVARRAEKYIADRRQEQADRMHEQNERRKAAVAELEKLAVEKQKRVKAADKKYYDARREAECKSKKCIADVEADIKQLGHDAEAEKLKLRQQELAELKGHGVNTAMVEDCRSQINAVQTELQYIDEVRSLVYDYRHDKAHLFDHEMEFKNDVKTLRNKLDQLEEKYKQRRQKHDGLITDFRKQLNELRDEKHGLQNDLKRTENFINDDSHAPLALATAKELSTQHSLGQTLDELRNVIISNLSRSEKLKKCVNEFKSNFSAKNTFNFRMDLPAEDDYVDFAGNLEDFLINNKIEEYRSRTSARYVDILNRLSNEMGELSRHESEVDKIINDINRDFKERNFVGVIKHISIRNVPSSDKMVQLMKHIKAFSDDNQFTMGELNLFSTSNRENVNRKAVDHLLDFMKALNEDPQRESLSLSDLFQLQFRIVENDNDTGWADKLSHVGSEGTDTLVKAMINIMLINVFKDKACRRFGDFRIHCMMDEIGKLHPQNVKGILDFANARNILLINSSPTTYNVSDYRYTYLLSKDDKSQTVVHQLIARQQ